MPTLAIIVASTLPGRIGLPNETMELASNAMLDELVRVEAALQPLRTGG